MIILVAVITSATQEGVRIAVQEAVTKTKAAVRNWRSGYLDPPETTVEVESDDGD